MGWFESHTTLTCMASGTVLTLAVHHESDDYLHTIVLAVIGAASSFLVSEFLKWIIRVLRRK